MPPPGPGYVNYTQYDPYTMWTDSYDPKDVRLSVWGERFGKHVGDKAKYQAVQDELAKKGVPTEIARDIASQSGIKVPHKQSGLGRKKSRKTRRSKRKTRKSSKK